MYRGILHSRMIADETADGPDGSILGSGDGACDVNAKLPGSCRPSSSEGRRLFR